MNHDKIRNLTLRPHGEIIKRLAKGEPEHRILHWLNNDSEVKAILKRAFGGQPISREELSDWIKGTQKTSGAETPAAPEQSLFTTDGDSSGHSCPPSPEPTTPIAPAVVPGASDAQSACSDQTDPSSRSHNLPASQTPFFKSDEGAGADLEIESQIAPTAATAKDALSVITARYVELLQQWGVLSDAEFNTKLLLIERLTKSALALRRSEQLDLRLELQREKQSSKSASSSPSLASRSKIAPAPRKSIPASKPTSSDQPAPSAPSDSSDQAGAPETPDASESRHSSILVSSFPPAPPTQYTQFPQTSKSRRSRFGLL